MADGNTATKAPKLSKTLPPKDSQGDGTKTLHLVLDPLQSIYVYADELLDPAKAQLKGKQGGSVTFVAQSGAKIAVVLLKTWFPAGTWSLEIGADGAIAGFKPLFPPDLPQAAIDAINRHGGKNDFVLQWKQNGEDAKAIKRMIASAAGKTIRLVVSFSKAKGGNPKSLPDRLALTAGDIGPLSDPALARMYLEFVEHWGEVKVDFKLADGGLTRGEIDQVEQNRPDIIAITDLFLQAFGEFKGAKDAASPPADLENFKAMAEAVFFQRKVNNDLARRNMLMIGMGSLLFTRDDGSKDLRPDIGVLRRTVNGGSRLLLYDRTGNPVRGIIGGFLDTEFRSTDLKKANRDPGIPLLGIEVEDEALYRFLRGLEQELAHPVREIEALAAGYYKYAVFINAEIHRRYGGEIGKRLIACAPVVIGFFVAHAIASRLIIVQPAVGVPFMLLVKGAGMVLGFDAAILDLGLMAEAGRHFAQMEQIGREQGEEKPRLTALSEGHLKAGAAALLDAMADIIALGVLIVGGAAVGKFGPALAQGVKNQAKARLRLTIEKDVATRIEPVKEMAEVKTAEPKAEGETAGLGAAETKPGGGDPQGTKPVEHPDAYKGEPMNSKPPEQPPFNPNRPKALDQSPEEFAKDTPEQKAAQQELFDRAKEAVPRQQAFIDSILSELKIAGAEAESILKRNIVSEFTKKIIEKVRDRKDYKTVGEMTDIIRGRVDLDNPADVERVKDAILSQGKVSVKDVQFQRVQAGVDGGYPRVHIEVIDPETGLVHEWQIGPKQATEVFETPGIDPAGIDIKPENTNLHDIEYDIFKSMEDPSDLLSLEEQAALRKLAQEVGIPEFRKKVAELAARTGKEKVPASELAQRIKELHTEAGAILKALVQKKGIPFVEGFLH
jgi:hypothetical protein